MASRYRLSIEREVNRKPQSKATNLVNYEPSPEPENQSPFLKSETTDNIEFLQSRLRSKAQIEHHVRKKLSGAQATINVWKSKCQSQAERADHFRDELIHTRKRHSEEVDELRRELRWNRKKVKALEQVIQENHNARSPRTVELAEVNKRVAEANDSLVQENMRLSEQIMVLSLEQQEHARRHEQLINELEQLKQDREGDLIDIQNLENAVKALHDENQILKETPIPVVLPPSQTGQQMLGRQMYHYESHRPVQPRVSLLDQRAQENRRQSRRPTHSRESAEPTRETWPYSSSIEDLSWNH